MNEQKYIKGFNHGYILSQHDPELLNQLLQSPNKENDYFDGLKSGHEEYEMEKAKQPMPDKLHSHDKNKDIEKDR
jgi:uncharacterized protein (DUF2249 family)